MELLFSFVYKQRPYAYYFLGQSLKKCPATGTRPPENRIPLENYCFSSRIISMTHRAIPNPKFRCPRWHPCLVMPYRRIGTRILLPPSTTLQPLNLFFERSFALSFSHTHTHTLSLSLSLTHTLSHSLSHTLTLTHTLSLSHTLSLTLSLSHTHARARAHTHTHTHEYTHKHIHARTYTQAKALKV